jgi:hypothetical protein
MTLGRPSTRLSIKLEWVYNCLVVPSCTHRLSDLEQRFLPMGPPNPLRLWCVISSDALNILTSLPGWAADNVRDPFDPPPCSHAFQMWLQAIAIILPRVRDQYGVSNNVIGALSSSTFAGMFLGAFIWGTCMYIGNRPLLHAY